MNFTPRFCATAALVGLILLAASPQSAAAALIPGTPLNGNNDGSPIVVSTTAALVGGNPYSDGILVDLSGETTAAPGDIVFLTPVTGSTELDEDRSNWAAVARFYSPSAPDGSGE